ncbi:MAG: DUF362 domain-containing protein [Candidatus Helarchaeota archaeon]|nr:DUF362 domain-containing protein [Candidatus Helarchaeota archaeon]
MPETIYHAKFEEGKEKRKEFTLKILETYKDQINGKVFIKPNMVSYEDYPTTTNPEILETVITHLQDRGLEIICGDAHAVDVKTEKVQDTTIIRICKKHDIKFLNLHKHPRKKFKSPRGFKIKMSLIPFQADSIISLPNLKTHRHWELRMTGALKMVVGYFTNWERIKMHMIIIKNRWKMIAEANWFLMKQENSPTHLTIMDAVQPLIHANELRHGGVPINVGYLFASSSPTVLDIHGFNLLKEYEPRYKDKTIAYVPYIKYAMKYLEEGPEYTLKEIPLNS